MDYKDYYKTLGVARDADEKQIKQAYRQLARQYHPDLNPNDEVSANKFKEVNEAYEVLSDTDKRKRYDQLGSNFQGFGGGGFDWANWASNSSSTANARRSHGTRIEYDSGSGGFSDFFTSIFGDMGRGSGSPGASTTSGSKRPIRGHDTELEVSIGLEEAYHGTTRQITRGSQQFTAHIPQGARQGTKVRFADQGERGFAGGQRGDLYLVINVDEHPVFSRDGDDLQMELKVPLYDAVLGGEVRVSTLAGDVMLRVPPGTQSGQRIRLNNKGMPQIRNKDKYGDLYVKILVQIPSPLTDEELELFEQLRDLRPNL